MIVIPAIDLKDGRCVRLRQGDMAAETVYSHDVAAVAGEWQDRGACLIHIVDLNGAVDGHPKNVDHIQTILQTVSVKIQVGGGIRHIDTIRRYLTLGVWRVVLGTAALNDRGVGHLAAAAGAQRLPRREADSIPDVSDAAVAEQHVHPARVEAAGGEVAAAVGRVADAVRAFPVRWERVGVVAVRVPAAVVLLADAVAVGDVVGRVQNVALRRRDQVGPGAGPGGVRDHGRVVPAAAGVDAPLDLADEGGVARPVGQLAHLHGRVVE